VGEGSERKRPDMVVRLPGRRSVVIDAKAPLDALAAAFAADSEGERRAQLLAHAQAVRGHVRALAGRGYARMVGGSAEFVVLFLPGEAALPAALEAMPELLDEAAEAGVIVATPSTLLALLKAVAVTWQHERATAHARDIVRLAAELAERASGVAEQLAAARKALGVAQEQIGRAEVAFEQKVLGSARRLARLGDPDGDERPEVSASSGP
jgi:DNA recombination protein RmuC